MPNLKNYGTVDNPIWMCDPPLTADASTTTPYNRYDQGMVSAANMIAAIKALITGGTIGNTMFFGTAVSGTEGDISVTVTGSKANDTYFNTSSFNFYKAVAANTWNYLGNCKGPAGTDGDDGIGISSATVNASGHLILTLTSGSDVDAGEVKGADGTDGVGSGWTVSTDSTSGSVSYALANGAYKVFTDSAVSAVTLTSGLSNTGDTCCVEFSSLSTASTYTKPTGCKHFGDDCDSSGDFTPAASTTYLLTFLKTYGGLKCFVKSM